MLLAHEGWNKHNDNTMNKLNGTIIHIHVTFFLMYPKEPTIKKKHYLSSSFFNPVCRPIYSFLFYPNSQDQKKKKLQKPLNEKISSEYLKQIRETNNFKAIIDIQEHLIYEEDHILSLAHSNPDELERFVRHKAYGNKRSGKDIHKVHCQWEYMA